MLLHISASLQTVQPAINTSNYINARELPKHFIKHTQKTCLWLMSGFMHKPDNSRSHQVMEETVKKHIPIYILFHYFRLPFLHYYFMVIHSTVLIITITISLFATDATLQLCLISKAPKSDSECLCNSYICTGFQKSMVLQFQPIQF